MGQINVSPIGTAWCGEIHANTCTNNRSHRELRIVAFNEDRFVGVKATSNSFKAIADCPEKVVLVLASDLCPAPN